MKRSFLSKAFCTTLVFLLLLQALPLSVFANENESTEAINNPTVIGNGQDDNLSVLFEIEENRTEYSKDFLLNDGSYYRVTTAFPMHTEVGGDWENISNTFDSIESNVDTSEVVETLATGVSESVNNNVETVSTYDVINSGPIGIAKSKLSAEYSASSGFGSNFLIKSPDGAIKVNTDDVNSYLLSDTVIKSANLIFNYSTTSDNTVYAYMGESEKSTELTINEFKLVDKKTTSSDGEEVDFDITDALNKWSLGILENNGIVIRSVGEENMTVNNFAITLNYELVEPNDIDFTYHSINMGNAGYAYINNYTNTMWVEQPIININSAVLPINISLINNSVRPVCEDGVVYGFTFNIESKLVDTEDAIVWNTFSNENKYFYFENATEAENGYHVIKADDGVDYQDNTSILIYIPTSDYENNTLNYKNIFIAQGDTKYRFNTEGQLTSVERPGPNNSVPQVKINYTSGRISSLETEKNVTYVFEYAFSDIGFENISKISVENTDDEVSFTMSVDFDENDNAIAITEINTITGEKLVNETDVYGNILKVTNSEGYCWNFEHKVDESDDKLIGHKVLAYTKSFVEEGICSEEFTVDFVALNGYYREIKKTQNNEVSTEIIQYDREHNIITHKDYNGNYVCAEYNGNGVISSYAFSDEESEELLDNPSFESMSEDQAKWNSGDNSTFEIVDSSYNDNSHGSKELKFSSNSLSTMTANQTVYGSFVKDNTYVVGAWVKVTDTLSAEESKIGLEVKNSNGNSMAFAEFDNSLNDEWQYRLLAFKPTSTCSSVNVILTANNQIGDIRFDEITLFEATDSQADLNNIITSSSVNVNYNDDGTISSEILTDGVYSMGQAYVYDNSGKIIETKDINGLSEYYKYNSLGKLVGTVKDADGEFEDATQLTYNSYGVLQTVTKTVNAVTTGNNKTMQTIYGTDNGRISSVYHGGIEYSFDYNPNGTISMIDVSPNYGSDDTVLVEFGYTGTSDIGYIIYENGYEINYTYDPNGNISLVECFKNDNETDTTELIKSYEYTYINGNLATSYDSKTGYTIVYSNGGYSYNTTRENEAESIELYSKAINENGETVENFRQAYHDGENNTLSDTITTSETISSTNSSTGKTTNVSSVSVEKNASDNKFSTMNYSRTSVTDYFNRITNKETSLVYETGNGKTYNVVSKTNYEYQLLDVGVTSGLISEYTTTISGDKANSNTGMLEYKSYSRKYEYDHRGNIKYVYAQNGTSVTPKEYYEYDEANQLVTAIDFSGGDVVQYTYDSSGNLASKVYYNYSNLNFNHDERTIVGLGSPTKSETFTHNASTIQYTYPDKTGQSVTSIIELDEMGNPKNYVGIDIDNAIVTGSLEWRGNLLTKFENSNHRIEYEYDLNGYRSTKTVYDVKTGNGIDPMYKMTYIWDNGILTNLIYAGGDSEELSLNIIYDQEGSPVGYITSMGLPYYFIKDVNENVVGLVHADGTLMYSISYDAWGTPYYSYHGKNILEDIIIKATAIFNPITYHGYIYDYETGMYCSQGRCYSPVWGRYLNPESPTALLEYSEDVLDANLYLFCNNNPVNNIDPYAMWSRDYVEVGWNARGFNVAMNDLFASRSFCTVFANQFLKEYGEWDAVNGYTYLGMNSLRIASDLFAHYVGKNAPTAINKTNAIWGEGWLQNAKDSNSITIKYNDKNAWKYEKIWYAAPEIKAYAWSEGVFITL